MNLLAYFICYNAMLNASSRGKCLVFGHCLMCECASTICFVHVALYRAYQHVGVSLSECDYIILYYIKNIFVVHITNIIRIEK